jgi:hypothetical protein
VADSNLLTLTPGLPELWVIFAHCDDEAIFFYHTIRQLKPQKLVFVCINTQLHKQHDIRNTELKNSAAYFGAQLIRLDIEETEIRDFDTAKLLHQLSKLNHPPGVPVLSHGVMGEYGHIGHVAAFKAVYQIFNTDVWVSSGPLKEDIVFNARLQEMQTQKEILKDIYPSQYKVHNWSSGIERWTHFSSSPFANILNPQNDKKNSVALLQLMHAKYKHGINGFPPDARQVGLNWDLDQLEEYLFERIDEWEIKLGTDV